MFFTMQVLNRIQVPACTADIARQYRGATLLSNLSTLQGGKQYEGLQRKHTACIDREEELLALVNISIALFQSGLRGCFRLNHVTYIYSLDLLRSISLQILIIIHLFSQL